MADIIAYIIAHPEKKWHTIRELSVHFGVNRNNITRKVRKLNEFNLLEVKVDGRTFLIGGKKDENRKL